MTLWLLSLYILWTIYIRITFNMKCTVWKTHISSQMKRNRLLYTQQHHERGSLLKSKLRIMIRYLTKTQCNSRGLCIPCKLMYRTIQQKHQPVIVFAFSTPPCKLDLLLKLDTSNNVSVSHT